MPEDWYEVPARAPSGPPRLTDILAGAQRRKAWLVLATLVGLALGLAGLKWISPSYTARTTILYEPREVPKEFVQSTLKESVQQELATLRERITSHANLQELIQLVGRERLDPEGEATDDGLIRSLRKKVQLEIGNAFSKDAQVFELVYSSHDPQLAADLVHELTGLFIRGVTDGRAAQARMTSVFLGAEVDRVGKELAVLGERMIAVRSTLPRHLILDRDDPASRERSAAILELSDELKRAESTYTDKHPDVVRLRGELRQLEGDRRAIDDVRAEDGANLILYEKLLRDQARLSARYEELRSKQLEARLASHLEDVTEGSRFEVLSPATPPRRPTFPDPILLIPGGLLGGFAVGLLFVVALEVLRPSFRSVSSVAEQFDTPVIASIPHLNRRQLRGGSPRPGVGEQLVVLTAPNSVPAQQYRRFLPWFVQREHAGVVLVTSASKGDGKSLTCANLAAVVATSLNRDVLLIDADLRRPGAHRLVGAEGKRGLSEVLTGEVTLDDAIVPTSIPRLAFLPAGRAAIDPTALLASTELVDLVRKARLDHSPIFIDSPPLLPVVDAQLLRRLADMVVFVVRADVTPRSGVARGLASLGDVAGIVFNDVRPGAYKRYYYEDSYAQYGADRT